MGMGKKRERERGKPRNRLLAMENKLMVTRGEVGEGMGERVMGIEGCTCHDERWMIKIKTLKK